MRTGPLQILKRSLIIETNHGTSFLYLDPNYADQVSGGAGYSLSGERSGLAFVGVCMKEKFVS